MLDVFGSRTPAGGVTDAVLDSVPEALFDTVACKLKVTLEPEAPKVALALLKRLGAPGFISRDTFEAQIERVYDGVTKRALVVAYGEGWGN